MVLIESLKHVCETAKSEIAMDSGKRLTFVAPLPYVKLLESSCAQEGLPCLAGEFN